jgi:CubicO group peptidase (beta-lactamase class C family)
MGLSKRESFSLVKSMKNATKQLFIIGSSLVSFTFCHPAIAIPISEFPTSRSALPDRSLRDSQRLDERVTAIMKKQRIPGMAVVVIKDGQAQ